MFAVLEENGLKFKKTFEGYWDACDYAETLEDSPGAIEIVEEHVILYHVTKTSSVPTILAKGLQPKIGWLSEILGETEPRIYFFPHEEEMHNALGNWMGQHIEEIEEEIGEKMPLSILKIRLPLSLKIPITSEVFYEKTVVQPISSEYITLLCNGQ